ncbi:DUF1963 domain-containing protein [Neorhizobium alkalisoli]|uniref:DUF1963 domain-containing protein n=1 Tax=Neorhizobium alkalisoli TaxID=528178 RepID=UPI000CF88417|nr:DUF1963 domain-containing protein [Neorhizobium alkalisoli]
MTARPQRWMTRDFVFTPPAAFPDVVARQLERFDLRPYPHDTELPSLFVLALDLGKPWEFDEAFAPLAADLVGQNGPAEWSLAAVQVLGREGRYGTGTGSSAKGESIAAGVALVRGRGNRVWAFGWRSASGDRETVERNYNVLMQSLQARANRISETTLRRQFEGQEKNRRAVIEAIDAGQRGSDATPDPADGVWEQRFATALGESDPSMVAGMFATAVALVEEPYGEEAPVGASRIGGGPDLPPNIWPGNARGMRHPFLMQINLTEITAACGPMRPLPDEGLLSFFVHDDALLLDVVYTPPGAALVRHPMTEAIVEASAAAVGVAGGLDPAGQPGSLPHTEGDVVTAELMADGTLKFTHTPDPLWAVGEPGRAFEALSDERWASTAYARLRFKRARSFDASGAEMRIEETGVGSLDELYETNEAFQRAVVGQHAGSATPQIHQMLGYATIQGNLDCREEAARLAVSAGHIDLGDPDGWIVLVWLRAGSATGREFWDADDLFIMAPAADLAGKRWDRCILLSG